MTNSELVFVEAVVLFHLLFLVFPSVSKFPALPDWSYLTPVVAFWFADCTPGQGDGQFYTWNRGCGSFFQPRILWVTWTSEKCQAATSGVKLNDIQCICNMYTNVFTNTYMYAVCNSTFGAINIIYILYILCIYIYITIKYSQQILPMIPTWNLCHVLPGSCWRSDPSGISK